MKYAHEGVPHTPTDYTCQKCNAHDVKLWRKAHHTRTFCRTCLEKDHPEEQHGDQIGPFVPAVPAKEDCSEFWGYTSVPIDAVLWWYDLKGLAKNQTTKCEDKERNVHLIRNLRDLIITPKCFSKADKRILLNWTLRKENKE